MKGHKRKSAYITKRLLVNKSTKAIQEASEEAMNIAGSIVVVRDGWVIRIFKDGKEEKIEELDTTQNNKQLIFD